MTSEITEAMVEAAGNELIGYGTNHSWFRCPATMAEFFKHDPIGYSEFGGAVTEMLEAALAAAQSRPSAARRTKLVALMSEVIPALEATGCNVSLAKDLRAAVAAIPTPSADAQDVGGCLTDVVSMSADVEDSRVLKLHFSRPVTVADRKRLFDLHNAYNRSTTDGQ